MAESKHSPCARSRHFVVGTCVQPIAPVRPPAPLLLLSAGEKSVRTRSSGPVTKEAFLLVGGLSRLCR